jgi:RNA polymerase sigma-70 factor (ECF subfamily)
LEFGRFFPVLFMNLNTITNDIMIGAMDKSSSSASDVLLLRRIAGGDELAFGVLYQRYHVPIFNYVLRLIHEPKEAEDLLQEIFIAVWRGAYRYREQAQVKTWLYRIAHYQAISCLRKRRPVTHIEDVLDINSDGPEHITADILQRDEVRKAINCLSTKHRAVLELAFVQGMAYKEIAQVVGCPVGTVKSRMSYALRALNGKLKKMD